MSELLVPFDTMPDTTEQDTDVSADTVALITEEQVLFATAAAVPMQSATTRCQIEASGNEAQPQRRHRRSRNDFLEDSRMAREMMRL
jgi:hypothetical protein